MMPTDLFDRDDNLVPLNTEDERKVRDFLVSLCADDACGEGELPMVLAGLSADERGDMRALKARRERYGDA